MHINLKKVLTCVLASTMLITSFSINSLSLTFAEELLSGSCGDSVIWTWDEATKTLTFIGDGDITTANEYKKYATATEHIIIEEGIEKIADDGSINSERRTGLFSDFKQLKSVKFPNSLTSIGHYAFINCPLEGELSLPSTLNHIGQCAFAYTNITSINSLNENMSLDAGAFQNCEFLEELTLPKGIIYKILVTNPPGPPQPFIYCSSLKKVTIEGGGDCYLRFQNPSKSGVPDSIFKYCPSLKEVIIENSVDYIGSCAFQPSSLDKIYFYNIDLTTITKKGTAGGMGSVTDSIDTTNDPKFYVIKGSKTEQTLKDAGYLTDDNVVYLATEDDINKLNVALEKNADTSEFTEDYVNKLNEAIDSGKAIVDKYKTDKFSGITLEEVNKALDVLEKPEYKPSSYTSVDEAIAKADKLDLSKYTDESVKALQDAINAVEKDLDITDQYKVDAFAKAIEDAIKGLVVKKTDSKPNKPNNSGTSKNPNVKPATSVPTTTRSSSQVAKDKKNAKKKVNQAKITNLKAKSKSKKKITVSWKKVKKAVGYEVQVSKTRKFKKALFDKFTTKKKITFKKKLKSGKIYYVRVRAYATYRDAYGKPQKAYGKWIKKVRKVKVK